VGYLIGLVQFSWPEFGKDQNIYWDLGRSPVAAPQRNSLAAGDPNYRDE
jgi:hypothetical protein